MTERKPEILLLTGIFAVSFLFCSIVFYGNYRHNEKIFYDKMAVIAASFPGEEHRLMRVLKEETGCDPAAGEAILRRYGYEGRLPVKGQNLRFGAGGLLFAGICTAAFLFYLRRENQRSRERIDHLTEYLRQVEEGEYWLSLEKGQDSFSNLEDEIYKTVLALRESRESLRREKQHLADDLADISHQFKTPLTALSVLGELLERHLFGTEDAALVSRMEGQIRRLTELTAALLTLSKADAGVLTFEKRQVPVSELIGCSLEAVEPLLEERKQQAECAGEDFLLCCDLGWTREALGNLIKNASDHGPKQSTISIRAWDNPVFSGIVVEDSGPGFSAKDLGHLFDRFYRGENAAEDSTGIGLCLAKSLIEGQGGEIRAENRKEKGARFIIKFYKHV